MAGQFWPALQRELEIEMAAYCTAFMKFNDINDIGFMQEYGAKSAELVAKHRGETLVFGRPEVVEGEMAHDDLLVIIKFPDAAAAKAFYSDPEYTPYKKIRLQNSKGSAAIVEQMPS